MKYDAENIDAILDLSPLQQGMLFHDTFDAEERSYVGVFRFRIEGSVDERRFAAAWRAVCLRHQALRASFHVREDGTPIQIIWKDAVADPVFADVRGLAGSEIEAVCTAHVERETARGFVLAEAPLVRVALFRVHDEVHELIVANHHIILDGWSLNIVLSEVFGEARGAPRPYSEFLDWLAQRDAHADALFWRGKIGHVESRTQLGISNRDAPAHARVDPHKAERVLPELLCRRLRELARTFGLTLNTVFTGAWALVSSRYSGKSEVVLGVTTSGRSGDFPGADDVVGLLINTVPVPIACPAAMTWSMWARKLQSELSGIREHEASPLVEITKLSAVSGGAPLFESIFLFQNYPAFDVGSDLRIVPTGSHELVNYPLAITVEADAGRIALSAEYCSDTFERRAIERLLAHVEQMLVSTSEHPDDELGALELLCAHEKRQLHAWGHPGCTYDGSAFAGSLILAQAHSTPDAAAAVCGTRTLSYAELGARSRTLAGYLAKRGVRSDVFVAICLERSLELLTAILGVVVAGGAYVPLDPTYPRERLAYMLADCNAKLIVASEATLPLFASADVPVVAIDRDWAEIDAGSGEATFPAPHADDAAYAIYTSGSTGKPKGVVVTQANLAHLVAATRSRFDLHATDRCLQFCSVSFDSSITDIFATLASGATLVLPPWRVPDSAQQFEEIICEAKITVVDLPTAYWHYWVDGLEPDSPAFSSALRLVMIGGEAYQPSAIARWNRVVGDRIALANNYGPTETTVNAIGYGPTGRNAALEEQTVLVGTPYGDARIYVLDGAMNVVPPGIRGEIYVGGPGVARGYLHRPEATAERFLPSPFEPSGRLYKTGDFGRFHLDGTIEYLGRTDDQVKIRGYRVELGEVENALAQHEAVREVAVVVREHAVGAQLVAYIVSNGSLSSAEMRAYLEARLPEYFIPSAYVFLDRLPMTPAGKVDRSFSAAREGRREDGGNAAPRTAIDEILSGIWALVLGVERVGIHENFFDLGGHSLLAMQVVSRIRSTLKKSVPLRSLFLYPTVSQLAEHLLENEDGPPLRIPRVSRDAPLELSFAQQRLWFINQLEPDTALYNVPISLLVTGQLDLAVFERSLNALVERHEVLRSTFGYAGDRPVQVIAPHPNVHLDFVDLTHVPPLERRAALDERTRNEALAPFDLSTGPILRCLVLTESADSHRIVINVHHIASDARSCEVLLRDLAASYSSVIAGGSGALPTLPVQYADYASWHRQFVSGPLLDRDLTYWKQRLGDAPRLLDLPTDRPRPAVNSYRGGTKTFSIGTDRRDALRAVAQREAVTLYMTLLAIFSVQMSRYSMQDEIVVGCPVANRSVPELEDVIGFFVNMLALRIDLGGAPTFAELLHRVRDVAVGAYDHQELPFDRLVEELQPERSRSSSPIYQVMCTLDGEPVTHGKLGDAAFEVRDVDIEACKFDLAVHFTESSAGIEGLFSYRVDLFDAATIERMIGHFQTLLDAVLTDQTQRTSELPILTAAEKDQLARWNARAEDANRVPLHRLVEAHAKERPGAAAVVCGDRTLTYAELERRAGELAQVLVARGIGREAVVAVCMERSADVPVALVAIWKAGAAYLPIDAGYPPERKRYILEDSGTALLLTAGVDADAFVPDGIRTLRLDMGPPAIPAGSEAPPSADPEPGDLAYVMYTSGSTGRPKGVMIEQRAIANHMHWMMETFPVVRDEVVLLKTALGFDASVWEVWLPLLTGAVLAVARPDDHKNPERLIETMRRHGVTTLQVVPSMLRALLDAGGLATCDRLKRVFCGGEVLHADLVDRFFETRTDCELINLYGPTEATIDATWWRCERDPGSTRVPIGRPLPNTQIRILDVNGDDVPVGVTGELYVGGTGVARGYLGKPELTAERFSTSPDGTRFYRTGDIARYRCDGAIEFVGRNDDQVKVRGFRIELGEIESSLLGHPAVGDAVVTVHGDGGVQLLTAYVVARAETSRETLRQHVLRTLPEYMAPALFVFLDAMPLSPNGKIDRTALPRPEREAANGGFVAPRDDVEHALAAIWTDVLGIERVGIDDNFFELGGHSLLAVRIASRIRTALGVDVPLARLFELLTIADIAAEVRDDAPVAAHAHEESHV